MRELIFFLSGEVPGGILILLFLLVVMNLVLYYLFKSSKLFESDVYKQKAIRGNVLLFGIYIILWFLLKSPELPDRVAILPFQNGNTVDLAVCEGLQQQIDGYLDAAYMLHRWEWFYQTASKDSLSLPDYRQNLARKMGVDVVISGEVSTRAEMVTIVVEVDKNGRINKSEYSGKTRSEIIPGITAWLREEYDILIPEMPKRELQDEATLVRLAKGRVLLLDEKDTEVIEMFTTGDAAGITLKAAAYLDQGIKEKNKSKNPGYHRDPMNPPFKKLLNSLLPYSKNEEDTAEMNIILAQMYLHTDVYGMAEVCLEKAVIQDPFNARVYYYMSFLHDSRYQERGFKTKTDVLARALALDPGYAEAAFALSNGFYMSGNGADSHPNTIRAIATLRNFLKLNPQTESVLSLLGKLLLQTKYTLESEAVYKKLTELYPESAEYHYSLGVCEYNLKQYENAKTHFNRAIEIEDFADAYLYIGAIYRLEGNLEKSLYYYRERVKRKSGDDDRYAREAMKGIRLILNDMAEAEEKAQSDENKNSPN